jgi:protein-S-isoprenylcysteine O-methyltransferase Ste14
MRHTIDARRVADLFTPARTILALTVALGLVGLFCLRAPRAQLSGTFDESTHMVAGMEWLQYGSYSAWTENPPLARIASALGPYLGGMRLPPLAEWDQRAPSPVRPWMVGLDLLYGGPGYETNLGRARLGTAPFFVLSLLAAWLLADGRRRPVSGLVAVGLLATLPALVGHGALATTDVALVATLLLAVHALVRWLDRATPARAAWLGAAFALALLTKFTTLVFFPVIAGALLLARRCAATANGSPPPRYRRLGHLALATASAALVTWAGYRFSFGRVDDLPARIVGLWTIVPPPHERGMLMRLLLGSPLPAPELVHGLLSLSAHNRLGHPAYLFGEVSPTGFPHFYLAALAVKTPLAFLAAAAVSLPLVARYARRPGNLVAVGALLAALAILLVSTASRVNLGIRHILPVLALLAIATGHGLDRALAADSRRLRLGAALFIGLALFAQTTVMLRSSPRQLAFFNSFVGTDPAAVLLDSDLDWGLDLYALRDEARRRQIKELNIAFFGGIHLCRHGLPPLRALRPGQPTRGWIAISENYYRERNNFFLRRDACNLREFYRGPQVPPHPFAWLRAHQPLAIVGSSIRLYHVE